MTTPQRPASQPLPGGPGWDDERLAAAFASRSARVVVPVDLAAVTVERLRPTVRRSPWARLLPAGAALVLVLAVVGGGIAMLGGPAGLLGSGAVTFRDGPTPDLRTLDGAEYALDFPASWLAYTATSAGASGGSIDAVLTTQPIEERCNSLMGVDINCVYEQRLEPGQLRIFVGSGSYRAQTVLDRADIENGSTTRLAVGGMPAILDEFDDAPDDYYLADQSATWAIATPTSLDRVIRIEFRAREPAVDAARAAAEAMVASFRFTPPPAPLPADPEAAAAAARAALDDEAASFRQGFVPAADTDGQTYLDCLPDAPGEDQVVGIDYGPGGDLGWTVLTRCRWTVVADEDGPFWRIDTVYEWTAGEQFGRYRESYWIDAAGVVVARTSSGDVPPAGARIIDLSEPGTEGSVPLTVTDLTGTLESVRGATAQELGFFTDVIPARDVRLVAMTDGGVIALWNASSCDTELVLAIESDGPGVPPSSISLRGVSGACGLATFRRGVWMSFSEHFEVTRVIARDFVPLATEPEVTVPSWGPWPPDGATVVELTSPVAAGQAPAQVAVVDASGALEVARAVRDDEPAIIDTVGSGDVVLWPDPTSPRRYRLRWLTSICDREMLVTVDVAVTRIVIDHAPRDGCDAMGVARELVLEFSRDVDPATVDLEVIPAELLPEATSPDVPAELFGLDVIDVDAARAVQARPDDDREIAVRGWIWRMNPATIDCLVFERTDVEELFFGEGCRSDSLLATADGTFDDAVLPLAIGQASIAALPFDTRVEVILIGHFDDRRSSLCSPPLAPRCADMFWVDAVWKDGALTPRDWFDPARAAPQRGPNHSHDAAWARVQGPDEDPLIPFSVGQVIGLTLARMEPVTAGELPAEVWFWHVTAYEPSSGRLRTFVIPDSVLGDYDGIVSYEVVDDAILITTAIID